MKYLFPNATLRDLLHFVALTQAKQYAKQRGLGFYFPNSSILYAYIAQEFAVSVSCGSAHIG